MAQIVEHFREFIRPTPVARYPDLGSLYQKEGQAGLVETVVKEDFDQLFNLKESMQEDREIQQNHSAIQKKAFDSSDSDDLPVVRKKSTQQMQTSFLSLNNLQVNPSLSREQVTSHLDLVIEMF